MMKKRSPWIGLIFLSFLYGYNDISFADCQGCCSWHGGVICSDGITTCADGTPLSSTCVQNGCDVCGTNDTDPPVISDPPITGNPDFSAIPANTITIASFNIQVFGVTKADNPAVMDLLAKTIAQFDVVAIQEIRDESATAIVELEKAIDAIGTDYSFIIGPRLGRTISKEQYAIIFRPDKILVEDYYTFDDSTDFFHREPLIAKLSTIGGIFTFVLITIHTDPDDATNEIYALDSVVLNAQANYPEEDDFIILGDLNADCTYFNESDPNCPLRDSSYLWLIGNEMDTTVSTTDCTYDRLISTGSTKEDFASFAGVYRFDEVYALDSSTALSVSDHYPVWSAFYIDKDSGSNIELNDGSQIAENEDGGGGGCFVTVARRSDKQF